MPIRWSTLIADENGVIDYDRFKAFWIIVAFVLACLALLTGVVLEYTRAVEVPVQMVGIASTLLIVPITGAAFGGMVGKHLQAKVVANATAAAMSTLQGSAPAAEPAQAPEG